MSPIPRHFITMIITQVCKQVKNNVTPREIPKTAAFENDPVL